jgi:hypothetical protein
MNGLDSNQPAFYTLLARAEEITTSLKLMRKVEHPDQQEMSDLHDELSATLEQMTAIATRWNIK